MEETKKEIDSTVKIAKVETEIDVATLISKVEALEKRDAENQEKLKMLYDVADKGRVLNYEGQRVGKKPMRVKLSVFQEGIITGWRTVKDILIKHPTTGLTVGEEQQFEVILLKQDGSTEKVEINGYPAFSDARYTERIEVAVVGKKEDYSGNIEFEVELPDGRKVLMNSRFVN